VKVKADKLPKMLTSQADPGTADLNIHCHSFLGNAKNRMFAQVIAFPFNNAQNTVANGAATNPCLPTGFGLRVRNCLTCRCWNALIAPRAHANVHAYAHAPVAEGRHCRLCRVERGSFE
jgi:hypothetical protein